MIFGYSISYCLADQIKQHLLYYENKILNDF